MSKLQNHSWWGAPKKFSSDFVERKISWLELFYDLVYVIAISKITHNLSEHLSVSGFLDYTYSFGLIFWGWFNGSLHHEVHGSKGSRTYLMTFWQIIIVAALIVTLNSPPDTMLFNATIAVMVMQVYITYLWWSVGIYDKTHRRLNRVYTISFLISLALMFTTLYFELPFVRILFYLSLVINYLPPFLIMRQMKKIGIDFSLSTSMSERLGLFTIIIFGEVVLGVITGISEFAKLDFTVWTTFALALFIVFALWWIFFSMIAERESKKGILNANLIPLFYIPTLMALGIVGVSFSKLFHGLGNHSDNIKIIFGFALSIFLLGIVTISQRTKYPSLDTKAKNTVLTVISLAAILIIILSVISSHFTLLSYLTILLLILIGIVISSRMQKLELTNESI